MSELLAEFITHLAQSNFSDASRVALKLIKEGKFAAMFRKLDWFVLHFRAGAAELFNFLVEDHKAIFPFIRINEAPRHALLLMVRLIWLTCKTRELDYKRAWDGLQEQCLINGCALGPDRSHERVLAELDEAMRSRDVLEAAIRVVAFTWAFIYPDRIKKWKKYAVVAQSNENLQRPHIKTGALPKRFHASPLGDVWSMVFMAAEDHSNRNILPFCHAMAKQGKELHLLNAVVAVCGLPWNRDEPSLVGVQIPEEVRALVDSDCGSVVVAPTVHRLQATILTHRLNAAVRSWRDGRTVKIPKTIYPDTKLEANQ